MQHSIILPYCDRQYKAVRTRLSQASSRPRQLCFIFIRDRHLPSPHRQRWVGVRGPLVEVCVHPSYTRHAICLQKMHQHDQHVCRDCICCQTFKGSIRNYLQRSLVATIVTPVVPNTRLDPFCCNQNRLGRCRTCISPCSHNSLHLTTLSTFQKI